MAQFDSHNRQECKNSTRNHSSKLTFWPSPEHLRADLRMHTPGKGVIPAVLLWLVVTFVTTMSVPAFVHSKGFSHASAAYAQDPSRANFDRLYKEREKLETKRVVFLLTRWMGFFGLGLAAFGVGKWVAQWQVRLRRRDRSALP